MPRKPAHLPAAPDSLEARSRVFKALAHPGRLLILDLLAGDEKCVCDIQTAVGSDMSTVSKHLALLRSAGLVRDERRGAWVYYRLCCGCFPSLLRCVDSVLRANAETQAGAVGCCIVNDETKDNCCS